MPNTTEDRTVYDELKDLLISSFQVLPEQISPDASLQDMELDSLDLVELSLAIEQRLGAKISDEEIVGLWTVGAILEAIETRAGQDA